MADMVIEGLTKVFDKGFIAVKNLSLVVHDREFLAIVGPSGCGKTTTLRMIAGLEYMDDGDIRVNGESITGYSTRRRNMAMVFQSPKLNPALTAWENITYLDRMIGMKDYAIKDKLVKVLEILDVESLLDRLPTSLSGGERQRIALARALMREPTVFLLDEPFANLDPLTRNAMQEALAQIRRRTNASFLYVTHDQTEAMTLADRILVMKEGKAQQLAAPDELYHSPCNVFVSRFIGSSEINLIPGTLKRSGVEFAVAVAGAVLRLDPRRCLLEELDRHTGEEVLVGIRPLDLTVLAPSEEAAPGAVMEARAEHSRSIGPNTWVTATAGGERIVAASDGPVPARGAILRLRVKALHIFDRATQHSILQPPVQEVAG